MPDGEGGGAAQAWSSLLLAAWLGASVLTAAVVAPAAFDVLPSRAFAGELVGRVLAPLYVAGIAIGLVAAFVEWRIRAAPMRPARVGAPLAMALACAAAQLLIAPRIASVRAAIGASIDLVSPDDPRREAFGRLHALSVAYLAVAMLAAVLTLWLARRISASSSRVSTAVQR